MSRSKYMDLFAFGFNDTYLDHGAYGAVPNEVEAACEKWRAHIARNPSRFYNDEQPAIWSNTANQIAKRFGGEENSTAIVANVTEGANAVIQSINLQTNDEILSTSLSHAGIGIALNDAVLRHGGKIVQAQLQFPYPDSQQCIEAVKASLSSDTKLAVFDHVTSKTALVLPIEEMTRICHERGVPVLIDGAHAPGHLPLNLSATNADWYVGNLHKWHFTKFCAFVWSRAGRQGNLKPVIKSYEIDRPFPQSFSWPGTRDALGMLSVEPAFAFVDRIGGKKIITSNQTLIREGMRLLSDEWKIKLTTPDHMIGSMAVVPLPAGINFDVTAEGGHALQNYLWEQHKIQTGYTCLNDQLYIRVSAQIYNDIEDYEKLALAVKQALRPALSPQ